MLVFMVNIYFFDSDISYLSLTDIYTVEDQQNIYQFSLVDHTFFKYYVEIYVHQSVVIYYR